MLQRQSSLFLPTLREDPADAEAVSHKLLVRAGLIRQVGAGLWTYLPAGWRVHEKVVQIVREEMDAIGGQEMSMPVLTPAELWQVSGRYDKFDSLMKIRDGSEREFVLAPTHEETVTFHARELRSYRDLPKILYHFQTKERDEARPRGGLLRVREFVMKDAYSFDRDEDGLDRSFLAHKAPTTQIFERCGLETVRRRSGVGDDGRERVARLTSPPPAPGRTRSSPASAATMRPTSRSRAASRAPRPSRSARRARRGGDARDHDLRRPCRASWAIDLAATSKAMPVVVDGDVVLALVRGDDRLDEAKLAGALGSPVRPAQADEIREAFGAEPGSLGPVRLRRDGSCSTRRCAKASSSRARTALASTCAASSTAETSRPSWRTSGSRARATPARAAVARSASSTAIEVGHIFKLGTFYSVPLDATYLDEQSVERPIVMGSYGIGPGRVLAAVVEQRHDERGIVWPAFDRAVRRPRPLAGGRLRRGRGARDRPRGGARPRQATTSCSTIATRGRARSSPTPTCSAARSRITVGRKSLDDGAVDVRRRTDDGDARVAARVCD